MRTIKILLGAAAVAAGVLAATPVFAASLYLSPQSGNYYVGHSFTVDVDVTSLDQAMNAAQGEISFPINKLQVISLSRANSIMTLWVQIPSFSNNDGVINFQGVAVNPGFQGSGGKILSITFLANASGDAPIKFLSGSVLANDGKGTNILGGMQNADMTLAPAPAGSTVTQNFLTTTITSNPTVSTGSWYNINAIAFRWNVPSAAQGVSYAISTNPQYQLPQVSQGIISQTSYDLTDIADGKWYFLVSFESDGTWSVPTMMEFNVDRAPPNPFNIVPENAGDLADTRPSFQWAAIDKTSGIADYQVKIGNGNWFEANTIKQGSSYILPPQSSTNSRMLTVRAFDDAGNFTDSSVNFQVLFPGVSCGGNNVSCRFSAFAAKWGWLVVLAFILLTLIAYTFIYRLIRWRKQSSKELQRFKEELRHDLEQIEKKDQRPTGGAVDLRREHFLKGKSSLEKEIQHITEEVKKEIENLEGKK